MKESIPIALLHQLTQTPRAEPKKDDPNKQFTFLIEDNNPMNESGKTTPGCKTVYKEVKEKNFHKSDHNSKKIQI